MINPAADNWLHRKSTMNRPTPNKTLNTEPVLSEVCHRECQKMTELRLRKKKATIEFRSK